MRLLTVALWMLAGLLLLVAVRSSQRFPSVHVARAERDPARRVHPLSDAFQEGRIGPCWDEVAPRLLHIAGDRWLGVGCDVEGARRAGESPECTVLRERVTACLRRHRSADDSPAPEPMRRRDQPRPGWGSVIEGGTPPGLAPLTPTS